MAVDPVFAQWLQGYPLWASRVHDSSAALWGARGITTERATGIATRADAEAESDRQLNFFSRGPFGVDEHQLQGTDWQRDIGRIITITGDQLGYGAGADVFVLEVEADRAAGISVVTVLVPLADLA